MRVLFAGPLFRWNTTESRRAALAALGHDVASIDTLSFVPDEPSVAAKLRRHLHIGRGVRALNRAVMKLGQELRPDLVWLDLPVQIYPSTVLALKRVSTTVVCWNSEYVGYRSYWFRHYFPAIPLYDAHVLTNDLTANIARRRKARQIVMTDFAYDPAVHHPMPPEAGHPEKTASHAVFVGHWEPTTEKFVRSLRADGIEVQVHGVNWHRAKSLRDRHSIHPVYGEDYVRAIAGARIALGFLSHWNRSQVTVRSFEIPAIGSFMLAERTPKHLSLYREGYEADFFSSVGELRQKARLYLQDDVRRRTLADNGHRRCVQSARTYVDEMRRILLSLSI
jgi:spore maturation protein CgeB